MVYASVGCGACDSVCKSVTLAHPTDNSDVLSGECRALMRSVSFDPSDLRGVRSLQHAAHVKRRFTSRNYHCRCWFAFTVICFSL